MVSSLAPTSASAPSAAPAAAPPLRPISSSLYGSNGQLGAGLVVGDHPAYERLALLDDLLHPLVERGEVVGGERHLDVEVVVEAVLDRRADAEPGVRVQRLHRLGHHVGGRVPQDRPAVGGVDRDRLDDVAVGQDVREVPQLAADPRGDHLPVALEDLRGRRAGGDLALAAVDGDAQVGHGVLLWPGGGADPGDATDRGTPVSPAFRLRPRRAPRRRPRRRPAAPPRRRRRGSGPGAGRPAAPRRPR